MPLHCDVVVDAGVKADDPGTLATLLEFAADSEPTLSDSRWQMTLRICADDTIAELHGRFFADPTPTDVITFPSGEAPGAGDVYLGDVVVSVETATRQSVEAGHSPQREVAFLALHGLLHLCGYDDTSEELRAAMHERQNALLIAWERERGRLW
ncbi:MAG TPA: rRNA maturation RNase YbeY [Thermomicrobiales bacterium]|nr:rRNA maturation RNase YbeY [Thermomicrobiales bacterium]